ncbi:hypothetical protein BJ085DRAFT_34737 [Dimargaris cristalligena]|uniref:Uncharacterized protein n=1 Tax=Dimargaris cristalligena TaxID=215637 RepID=A0A4V1J3T1_9FUNG|nr:hypothetical protein BJ085DRAFT_34737 [Dimargaris cristalligena]|eukprot:RKP33139.1 hypothetical protein BJ085DRAFT_34737 [Dimargaris cristalligena]
MDTNPLNIQTDSLNLETSSAALSPMSIEPPTVQYNLMNSNIIDEIQHLAPIFYRKLDGPSWEHWGLDIHRAKARAKEAVVQLGKINMWCTKVITTLLAKFSDQLTLAPNYIWDTDMSHL